MEFLLLRGLRFRGVLPHSLSSFEWCRVFLQWGSHCCGEHRIGLPVRSWYNRCMYCKRGQCLVRFDVFRKSDNCRSYVTAESWRFFGLPSPYVSLADGIALFSVFLFVCFLIFTRHRIYFFMVRKVQQIHPKNNSICCRWNFSNLSSQKNTRTLSKFEPVK